MIKMRIGAVVFTLADDGIWQGENPTTVAYLNSAYAVRPDEPLGYDPDPMLSTARRAAQRLGGEVFDKGEPDDDSPDTVY